jgi:hypothetical protein
MLDGIHANRRQCASHNKHADNSIRHVNGVERWYYYTVADLFYVNNAALCVPLPPSLLPTFYVDSADAVSVPRASTVVEELQ